LEAGIDAASPPNASKGNTWNAPGPSAAKATTSAAEARKVALLCGHYLDRLRVLAMASVVRLNGGTIDQMANPFSSSDQRGATSNRSHVWHYWSTYDLALHQIELQVIGSTNGDRFAR
jgi:hypothetical protein